ncbi:transporter substrate-binding domain-containing protein [Marinobacteraceae bacterium S3BR75-40.1]
MHRTGIVTLALLIWLPMSTLWAQPPSAVPVYLEDEPIYTSSNPDTPGFLMEIFQAMSSHLKIHTEVHFMPWNRAQAEASRTPNALIFPLARTEPRESLYLWLCQVFDVPVMFVTKKGQPVIDSFEQARSVRGIGVIIGTPQERMLEQQGVPHVSFTGKELYQALADDHINALYTARPEAVFGWRRGGFEGDLQYGNTLQTLPLWIAAGKDSTWLNPRDWQAALNRVKESGFYQRKEQEYFGH